MEIKRTEVVNAEPATASVPVDLLKAWSDDLLHIGGFATGQIGQQIADRIPKPKPRLVAVDLDQFKLAYQREIWSVASAEEYLSSQPDLLTLLDDLIDREVLSSRDAGNLKGGIRIALGVAE